MYITGPDKQDLPVSTQEQVAALTAEAGMLREAANNSMREAHMLWPTKAKDAHVLVCGAHEYYGMANALVLKAWEIALEARV